MPLDSGYISKWYQQDELMDYMWNVKDGNQA